MKKGFTLVELIGVIVIIAAIALIVIPTVDSQIKKGKQDMYAKEIEVIKQASEVWFNDKNINLKENEGITILLSQLKMERFLDNELKNPITKEYFPNDMKIVISNFSGEITYEVLENTGTNKVKYSDDLPKITLKGNVLEYVELSSTGANTFNDLGAVAKDGVGIPVEVVVTTSPTIDSSKKGIYIRTYTATINGFTNQLNRTIIVRDTTSPVINFATPTLTVSLSSLSTYNFLADVTATDNSTDTIDIKVETNFSALAGTYTIKYTATDKSGNVATKFRDIIVN